MRPEARAAEHLRDSLIDRTQELADLISAFEDSLASHGRLVALGGEAGIGKTRLAEEVAGRAIAAGARVFWGRCWEGRGAPAYWPWIQVLRETLRSFNLGSQTPEVARIAEVLPELVSSSHFTAAEPIADSSTSASPALDSMTMARLRVMGGDGGEMESARFRMFDAVSALLRGVAEKAPIVIILDDLHLADIDSLLLLNFIARDISHSKILLIATLREMEEDGSQQHAAILHDVTREATYIQLHGLSEADTAALVTRHSGVELDEALLQSLYRTTEGNPFFVDEIVRLMLAEGKLRDGGAIETGFRIPNSVRTAVRRRLEVLPSDAKSALAVAAVIGNEFNLMALARVSGTPIDRVIDALEQARRRGIIGEVAGIAGRYRFTHAIVAESLRADLGMTQSMRLHQRVGEELEQIYGADPAPHGAELAYHFSKALALGTADKALRYAREGARHASEKLAHEEAVRLYQMALDAHSALFNSANAARCELLIALGDAQCKDGDRGRARKTFHEAAQVARAIKRADLLARAALQASAGMGTFFVVDSDLVTMLEEAAAAIGNDDPAMRAALLACLAHELRWSERFDHAIQLSGEAIGIARECGDRPALIAALWSQHDLNWAPENVDNRFAVADEILRIAGEIGALPWLLRAHETRLSARLEIGDIGAVDAGVEAAEELRVRAGHEFAAIDRFRITRSLMRGDFDDAEALIFKLMGEAQRRQDVTLTTVVGAQLLMLRSEQGRMEESEPVLKGSVVRFPTMTAARCSLANFYARTGRHSEAREEFEILARNGFRQIAHDWNWLGSLAICAEVCWTLGDAARAAVLYDLLSSFATRNVTMGWGVICYGSMSRYLGLLAATQHRYDDAEKRFEDAIRFELRMGAVPFVARTRVCYAAMLIARGAPSDLERARVLLEMAIEAAGALKMMVLVRLASETAERLENPALIQRPSIGVSGVAERRVSTIMFLDIVDSTAHAARVGDSHWHSVIERFQTVVRDKLKKFRGREINTAGDEFFVVFGEPADAVRCARAVRASLLKMALQIRVGIHTGECQITHDDVLGLAVHIGARMVRKAAPGQVIVSAMVKDLVDDVAIDFADHGVHQLRGIPGEWRLFEAK